MIFLPRRSSIDPRTVAISVPATLTELIGDGALGLRTATSRNGNAQLQGFPKEYTKSVASTIHRARLARPKTDPHLQAAGERVKAAAEELQNLGIADKNGKRLRTDLPKDMREGADRDFGG